MWFNSAFFLIFSISFSLFFFNQAISIGVFPLKHQITIQRVFNNFVSPMSSRSEKKLENPESHILKPPLASAVQWVIFQWFKEFGPGIMWKKTFVHDYMDTWNQAARTIRKVQIGKLQDDQKSGGSSRFWLWLHEWMRIDAKIWKLNGSWWVIVTELRVKVFQVI